MVATFQRALTQPGLRDAGTLGARAQATSPASTAPSANVCDVVAQAGAMAVLGEYGSGRGS
jgi:hypothetical protein